MTLRYEDILGIQRELTINPFPVKAGLTSTTVFDRQMEDIGLSTEDCAEACLSQAARGACFVWIPDTTHFVEHASSQLVERGEFSYYIPPEWLPQSTGIMWLQAPTIANKPPSEMMYRFIGWTQAWSETDGPRPWLSLIDGYMWQTDTKQIGYQYDVFGAIELSTAHISGATFFGSDVDIHIGVTAPVFYSALHFIHESIVQPKSFAESVSRQRRKRVSGDVSNVRIVHLRYAKERQANGNSGREYSHRWAVSGHWRDQWYPRMQIHLPKWINPYVKGPEDKPLVIKDSVYAVTR